MRNHLWIVLVCLWIHPPAFAGKKHCQPYLEKLRNIQSQQRVGHSNQRSRTLAAKEQKARDTWWQCQQGKLKPRNEPKNKKATTRKPSKTKAQITATSKATTYSQQLVLKGEFQGHKQQAWLDYYRMPKKCKRPKSTQTFAFCMEDRKRQQREFERQF